MAPMNQIQNNFNFPIGLHFFHIYKNKLHVRIILARYYNKQLQLILD